MKSKDNSRGLTFRINLENEKEKKLYEQLMDKEHGSCSMSAYVKSILFDHFSNEEKQRVLADYFHEMQQCQKKALDDIRKTVQEEMHKHDIKMMSLLISNGNDKNEVPEDKQKKEKGMELPSESKNLPEGMDQVLDMFET